MITTTCVNPIKKVAIFCDFLNSLGGTEFYNTQLGILLKNKGIEVRFYVGERPRQDYWGKILDKENIPILYPNEFHASFQSREIEKEFINQVHNELKVWQPDIIHTHPAGKLIISWLEKGFNKTIPIVATEWTTPSESTAHWYQPEIFQYVNEISAFVATCRESEKGLRNYLGYKGEIVVIPHLVPSPSVLISDISINNMSIGCISRLSVEKGLDFLIAAMLKVITEFPSATLHIYGQGDDETRLKELSKCLGISDHIFFEGVYEPFVGIDSVSNRHSIFVQPSLFESIPTTIIELIARHRVIIATKVGGIPELFENSKFNAVIGRASTEELYKAIIELLSSTERIKLASQESIEIFNSKYNLERSINSILELYSRLLLPLRTPERNPISI